MSIPQGDEIEAIKGEEAAAMVALGLGNGHEVAAELVDRMAEAAASLAQIVRPAAPPDSIKNRLIRRVAQFEELKPLADVRPYDGDWVSVGIPGVEMRSLFKDSQTGRTTMLVRMERGVRFPAHYHHDDEQCLVIKGDVRWGELVYEEGDFVVMGRATTHPEIRTEQGNLLLIVAGRNEFVRV